VDWIQLALRYVYWLALLNTIAFDFYGWVGGREGILGQLRDY
jgi:hypothetical protein